MGGAGDDRLDSGRNSSHGNIRFGYEDQLKADAGADVFVGRNPFVEVSLRGAPRGMAVDLGAGTVRGWGRDTISGISKIVGTRHADRMLGTASAETFSGELGADVLVGRAGDDHLYGDGGDDVVRGDGGSDHLRVAAAGAVALGGAGDDIIEAAQGARAEGQDGDDGLAPYGEARLLGGAGRDALALDLLTRGARTDLAAGTVVFGVRQITVAGVEDVGGTAYDDVILGDAGDNFLDGGTGNDRLVGNDGHDTLQGYEGEDDVDGGAGVDRCAGETTTDCEVDTTDVLFGGPVTARVPAGRMTGWTA
jgi:Ca2+-binding RTX toxin-like protein